MDGYVREVIEEEDLSLKNKQRDQANTPASMDLFRIDGTSPDLKKGWRPLSYNDSEIAISGAPSSARLTNSRLLPLYQGQATDGRGLEQT